MGALTDPRKRSSTDLCLPLYPPFTSPTKKLRVTSSTCPPSAAVKPVSLPSNPHHPRPSLPSHCIHAPQRNIRAFGLGSSPAQRRGPVKVTETVNELSQSFQRKPDEGLALHEYRRLVEEHNASPCDEPVKVNLFRSDSYSSELKEAELFHSSDVPSLTVDDRRTQALSLEQVRKKQTAVKSKPVFKKLYVKSKERDPRLNQLQFEVKVYQQKAHVFRNAVEVLRIKEDKPKKDHEKLFGPLIAKEEDDVYSALFNGSSSEVLVTHESSNIVITREVIQCLRPGAWLNDEVINLYLELLKEREKREPKKFLKCHFFSTFFYKKLTSAKHGYDFKAVKRWTTQRKLGYALIECDKIFVPIHKEIHWCLAVINVKDECFQYLDSLGGLDNYALKMLARYLMDEIVDKSAKKIDTLSWKKESVDGLPLQKNGWDCGMFILKYADFYSRGSKLCFNQDHMSYFRKRTALEILRLRAD